MALPLQASEESFTARGLFFFTYSILVMLSQESDIPLQALTLVTLTWQSGGQLGGLEGQGGSGAFLRSTPAMTFLLMMREMVEMAWYHF